MYDQIREDTLFIIFYTLVTAMAMMASFYLMFRQGNAIAADITPPVRLRRWTAVFFASVALNHIWYMPIFFLSSTEGILMTDLIGGLLDCMTLFPLAIVVLSVMLQDRRRPLWPVALMMIPIIAAGIFNVANHNYALLPLIYIYFFLMCLGLIIYMVRALKQYGRWLRDNFADLENKEVWQSFVVLTIIMLVFVVYAFTSEGPAYQYAMQSVIFVLICYLLWRVETLSNLSIHDSLPFPVDEETATTTEYAEDTNLSQTSHDNIGSLLQQYCIDTQLYLQHDLTLIQLSKAIGTNRLYLSRYFSCQGMNYNAYVNNLRINHFVNLYREAVVARQSFTIKQLAHESGYRSYSTFNDAFKRKMGQSVTAWMKTLHGGLE